MDIEKKRFTVGEYVGLIRSLSTVLKDDARWMDEWMGHHLGPSVECLNIQHGCC